MDDSSRLFILLFAVGLGQGVVAWKLFGCRV